MVLIGNRTLQRWKSAQKFKENCFLQCAHGVASIYYVCKCVNSRKHRQSIIKIILILVSISFFIKYTRDNKWILNFTNVINIIIRLHILISEFPGVHRERKVGIDPSLTNLVATTNGKRRKRPVVVLVLFVRIHSTIGVVSSLQWSCHPRIDGHEQQYPPASMQTYNIQFFRRDGIHDTEDKS